MHNTKHTSIPEKKNTTSPKFLTVSKYVALSLKAAVKMCWIEIILNLHFYLLQETEVA